MLPIIGQSQFGWDFALVTVCAVQGGHGSFGNQGCLVEKCKNYGHFLCPSDTTPSPTPCDDVNTVDLMIAHGVVKVWVVGCLCPLLCCSSLPESTNG